MVTATSAAFSGKPPMNPGFCANQSFQNCSMKVKCKRGTCKNWPSRQLNDLYHGHCVWREYPRFQRKFRMATSAALLIFDLRTSPPQVAVTAQCDRALERNARGSAPSVTSKNERPPCRTHFSFRACFRAKTAACCAFAATRSPITETRGRQKSSRLLQL